MILSRCPECATTFRVTPEQLKARHGMVRCGQCGTAFNALDGLVTEPAAPAAGAMPQSFDEPAAGSAARGAAGAADNLAATAAEPVPESEDEAAFAPSVESLQEEPAAAAPNASEAAHGRLQVPATVGAEDALPAPQLPGAEATQLPPAAEPTGDHETPAPQAQEHAPAASPAPPARRRWPHFALGLSVLLAFVLAVGQAAVLFRSELARSLPSWRPALEQLCAALDCRIELPQQAELISIEISDLQPAPQHPGWLVLAATLRNRADFAQAFPHLELTLTDGRDQALVRRVFPPGEYLKTAAEATAGFAANAEQAVQLVLDANGVAAAGYRLYVFYP